MIIVAKNRTLAPALLRVTSGYGAVHAGGKPGIDLCAPPTLETGEAKPRHSHSRGLADGQRQPPDRERVRTRREAQIDVGDAGELAHARGVPNPDAVVADLQLDPARRSRALDVHRAGARGPFVIAG